jgi:hypothetical protein
MKGQDCSLHLLSLVYLLVALWLDTQHSSTASPGQLIPPYGMTKFCSQGYYPPSTPSGIEHPVIAVLILNLPC